MGIGHFARLGGIARLRHKYTSFLAGAPAPYSLLIQISLLTWGSGWGNCGGTLLTWTLRKATANWCLIILGLPVPSKIFKMI